MDAPTPNLRQMWNFSDPAGSEIRFRDLLLATEDPAFRCEISTQVARAQGLQRKFDEARATLAQVQSTLPEGAARARVRYLLELGRVHNSSGEKAIAKELFLQAFNEGVKANEEFLAIDAAHMVAIVEDSPKGQLEWNDKAIGMAETANDPEARNWLGSLYNNTAWTYHDTGDYEKALDLFTRALAFRQEQGDQDTINIAKWCRAKCLRSMGRVDEALQWQQELYDTHASLNKRSGYVFEELGECLLALGRPEEAKPHFAEAYAELSKDPYLAQHEQKRLERLRELGA